MGDFARRRHALALWIRNAWVPLVLVVVAIISGGVLTASHSDQFAPFDEWVYYDYTVKFPSQGVVRQGEYIGHEALVGMACDGDAFGPRGEPCDNVQDIHANYPQQGKTSADIYTPLYFAITWVLGKGIQFVTGAEFLTAARATGIFWLVGGLLVFYKLLRLLKVRKFIALGLGLVVIGAPTTFWANTYISTDAPAFLVGASVLLAGVSAIQGRSSPWWLVPIAVVAILLKVTMVLALGVGVLLILLYLLFARDAVEAPQRRRLLFATVTALAVAGIAQIGWLLVRAQISLGTGADQGLAKDFLWRDIVGMLSLFINPGALGGGYLAEMRLPPVIGAPLVLLTVAGVIGFALSRLPTAFDKALAIAVTVSATLFAPILAIGMYLLLGDVFPVLARYAMPLLPAFFVTTALIVKNRAAEWVIVLYGGFLIVAVIATSVLFG